MTRTGSQGKVVIVQLNGKDLTYAEQERIRMVLGALQGKSPVLSRPLIRHIFIPPNAEDALEQSDSSDLTRVPPSLHCDQPLNVSQILAVEHILSETAQDRVCLVQGPPGTGKTIVIAAAVRSIMDNPQYDHEENKRYVWLTAQSNVAVKNLAEKLADIGFWDFKLIVAKESHFEWYTVLCFRRLSQY